MRNEYNLSNHQMNLFKLPLLTLTMPATHEECKKCGKFPAKCFSILPCICIKNALRCSLFFAVCSDDGWTAALHLQLMMMA